MLIKRDQDTIRSYFEDSSNLKGGHADEVAFPETIGELSEILKNASAENTPVSISGGGTGTTGSRIPFGGVVISMEKFNRIVEISKERMSATVEAGVLVEDFKNSCEKRGLFYPCHPTEKTASIGGTVSTNASGARSFKYGPTRRYVKALKMLTSDGSRIDLRRGEARLTKKDSTIRLANGREIRIPLPGYDMPLVKNSAGYFALDGMDAIDLFIGQEGTLSVIVEVEMALTKKPFKIFGCFVFFDKEPDAWSYSAALKDEDGILSIEYFDSNALKLLRGVNRNVPGTSAAAIFFEQEIEEDPEGSAIEGLEGLISKHNSSLEDTWVAITVKELDKFTEFRHSIPEEINEIVRRSGFRKFSTDIAVPGNKFLDMMEFYKKTFADGGIEHVIFGHIGEGHIHTNLLPKSEKEAMKAKEICLELVRKGVALGGTPSAEHGIGKTRRRYLEVMYGKKGILEMARVKKALDPACILGLDNIFSKEILAQV